MQYFLTDFLTSKSYWYYFVSADIPLSIKLIPAIVRAVEVSGLQSVTLIGGHVVKTWSIQKEMHICSVIIFNQCISAK